MSDFIFTDEESQAKAAALPGAEPAKQQKKKRAPAKRSPARPAPARTVAAPVSRPSRVPSSGGNSTAWLLIFICLLAVAAYFAYQYYELKRNESTSLAETGYQAPMNESSTPETVQTPADPAANWLVFAYPETSASSTASTTASATPAFRLKYPTNAKINKTDKRVVFDIVGATSTSFIVSWEKSTKDLPTYLKALDKVSAKSWEGKPAVQVVTSTVAVMADKYPVVLRQQKMLAADLNQYIAYVKTSSTIYSVALTSPQLTDGEAAAFTVFLNNFQIMQ